MPSALGLRLVSFTARCSDFGEDVPDDGLCGVWDMGVATDLSLYGWQKGVCETHWAGYGLYWHVSAF